MDDEPSRDLKSLCNGDAIERRVLIIFWLVVRSRLHQRRGGSKEFLVVFCCEGKYYNLLNPDSLKRISSLFDGISFLILRLTFSLMLQSYWSKLTQTRVC